MAQLHPSLPPDLNPVFHGGLYRELDVLERLEASLPAGYHIFHSVGWQTIYEGQDTYGEIDLVVLGPLGNLLLIEVKAGSVVLEDGGITKHYASAPGRGKNVIQQMQRQYAALRSRLQQAGLNPGVGSCLVLPDCRVGDIHIVALPRERILDAQQFGSLGTHVQALMRETRQTADPLALQAFLSNHFKVSPDIQVLGQQLETLTRRMSEGLATWVPRVASPSGLVRVQATAGSGKTLLALRLLEAAVAKGQRTLYVSFNRTLADHVGRLAPTRSRVASFHELCVDFWRQNRGEPAFNQPGCFEAMTRFYAQNAELHTLQYDLIVLDEGQDFEPFWVESLLQQLQPDGRFYLLEDEAQRLYTRDEFDLGDAVCITSQDNFRTPRLLCSLINMLNLAPEPIEPRCPHEGSWPGFHVYDDDASLQKQTLHALNRLLEQGISAEGIVVLSGRGIQKSTLLQCPKLGPWRLRRFTGLYAGGEPEWHEGELLAESVYRFKGQSAYGVVFTELDFEELDVATRRKLFVGITRANIAIEFVLSRQAEACLTGVLSQ